MGNEKLKADAQAMNAMATALGALTFALIRALPADKRAGFASDMAAMAQARNEAGDTTAEMLLMDLHRAAIAATQSAG